MDIKIWLGLFCICYVLSGYNTQRNDVKKKNVVIHDTECPRKVEMTLERKCLKKCRNDLDCRGRNKRCLCDDVCGKSCVKQTRRCENLKTIFNGHYNISPFNTFGAKVRYTCNEGYILSGQPERVCQGDGYWSGAPPTCETEGKCRNPPVVPHATHDGPKGQSVFPLGTQLTYACTEGYNIDGFFRAMCVGEGRWVGPRMTCSPRRCGHPGDIPHGQREGTIFVYPNQVTYKCSEGYELVGRPFRECKPSGQWSGSLPVCLPVKCPRLSSPANGNIHGNDFTYGAVVKHTCLRGFTLIGSETRRCTQDGTWNGNDASCPMVDCGLPGPFYNGYLDGQQTTFGAIIFFRCFGRSVFSGGYTSATCEESGEWSHEVPKCWSKCEVPKVTNGTVLGQEPGVFANHDTFLTFECSKGFVLNDTANPVCFNGSWTFIPECIPAPCKERPSDLRDGIMRFYTMRHGDKAKYLCNTGYKLEGDDFVTCLYGDWVGENPYCEQIYCDHPGTIANGQILLVGVIGKYEYRPYVKRIGHNDQIEFHCNKGYIRVGPMAATCVDGHWSPDIKPSCVPGKYPKLMYIFRGKRDLTRVDNKLENVMEDYDQFDKGFCSIPSIPHGVVANFPADYYVYHGSKMEVSCDPGYNVEMNTETNHVELPWCNDGMWSQLPDCVQTQVKGRCASPGVFENGNILHITSNGESTQISSEVFLNNDQIEFHCTKGFKRDGPRIATCYNSHWSPYIIPTCIPDSITKLKP